MGNVTQGETWRVVNVSIDPSVQATWLIEGAVASSIEQSMWLQVFRTAAGSVYGSMSPDDGLHWSPARPLPLLNPNSKVCSSHCAFLLTTCLTYQDDRMADVGQAGAAVMPSCRLTWLRCHWACSCWLTMTSSPTGAAFRWPPLLDDGESWRRVVVLEADARGSFTLPHHSVPPQRGAPELVGAHTRPCTWDQHYEGVHGGVQDRVVVIYSVDYLPDGGMISDLNSSPSRQGGCSWGREHKAESPSISLVSAEGWAVGELLRTSSSTSSSTSSNSQCRPVGAWGRVSYGMRVAMLKASEIVRSAKQEPALAAER